MGFICGCLSLSQRYSLKPPLPRRSDADFFSGQNHSDPALSRLFSEKNIIISDSYLFNELFFPEAPWPASRLEQKYISNQKKYSGKPP
jgi:hypothetical protein